MNDVRAKVPSPPHPHRRNEPLPSQSPKSPAEDPDAPARIAAIRKTAAYRLAEQDVEFLGSDAMRGLRLQLEYQKPELLFEEHAIAHTIVVFGSSRICEPGTARRNVEALRLALVGKPGDAELARRLAAAERILAKSHYYDVARAFGRLVGEADRNPASPCIAVMTGGGPGMMEAANRGSFDVGAKTIGLNIDLPHEQYPNPYVTPDLCVRFHYFALRKLHFVLRAKALVAFPGGFGTLDELFEILTLVQTRKMKPVPIVLVGEAYWRRAVDFDFLLDEGVIEQEDRALFWFAETAEEIWRGILHWHEVAGKPLCGIGGSQ
jgi:uncharacterized protein (TIGR00730 family)